MKQLQLLSLLLLVVIGAMLPGTASAFTWTVPTHFNTIQGAIDHASSGDKIRIGPGTYRENLAINGKRITLEPAGDDFAVIIDGQGNTCITLSGGEGPSTVIKGLTLQNGGGANGGGIKSNNSLATIKNCLIQNNTVTGNGGGVHGHSGLISGCRIINNSASQGGGVSDSDGIIQSNHIAKNVATQSGGGIANASGDILFNTIKLNKAGQRGGGIAESSANIRGNLIEANETTTAGSQAQPGSFGAGLANCTGLIEQNRISGNVSLGNGGGLDGCTSTVRNNIINGNSARSGGGVSNSNGRLEHNVVYGNFAFYSGGGMLDSASPVNSILWANAASSGAQISGANAPEFSCVQDWFGGGNGVLTMDPRFVNASKGDFHLLSDSPMIDAGKLIVDTLYDFEDDPRGTVGTLVKNLGDGSNYDIGADEYVPPFINLTGNWKKTKATYKLKSNVVYTKIKGSAIVMNEGNVPTGALTEVRYYLSNDAVFDAGDQEIGVPKPLKPMKPGAAKLLRMKAKLPPGQVATGKFLLAVVDGPDVVLESNENDNVLVSEPLP